MMSNVEQELRLFFDQESGNPCPVEYEKGLIKWAESQSCYFVKFARQSF